MFDREFQVLGAVEWKARPKKVLWNGMDSSGTVQDFGSLLYLCAHFI